MRHWLWALLVAAAASLCAACSSSSHDDRYGRTAVAVLHELGVCDDPVVSNESTARCESVVVTTFPDRQTQEYFVAILQDEKPQSPRCQVSGPGYVIGAPNRSTLSAAVSASEAHFAARLDGVVVSC